MSCSFSPGERLAVRNVVLREWSPYMSSDELRLLLYVMDNSIEWGRQWLEATYEQMAAGVPAEEGSGYNWRAWPIGISRPTFYRTLARLKERGALIVETLPRKFTRFRINLLWTPAEGVPSPRYAMSKLPTPKRFQAQQRPDGSQSETQTGDDLGSQSETLWVSNRDTYKTERSQQNETTLHRAAPSESRSLVPEPKIRKRTRPQSPAEDQTPPPIAPTPSPETAREAVQRVQAQSRQRRVEQAKAARTDARPAALEATFRQAWGETFEGTSIPAWGKSERGMVGAMLKRRFPQDVAARHEFLDFVVRGWKRIMADHFRWMTKGTPALPALPFLCADKLNPVFLDAFADRKRREKISLLPAEAAEIERLVATGKTREEALLAAGERRALSRQKAEKQEARRQTGDALRRAEEERKQIAAERRDLLRQRAELSRQSQDGGQPPAEEEGFPELGEMPSPPSLAPFDPSKWN